jgi:hypothetical protein
MAGFQPATDSNRNCSASGESSHPLIAHLIAHLIESAWLLFPEPLFPEPYVSPRTIDAMGPNGFMASPGPLKRTIARIDEVCDEVL